MKTKKRWRGNVISEIAQKIIGKTSIASTKALTPNFAVLPLNCFKGKSNFN